MNNLAVVYDETKVNKRLPFDIEAITDTLLAPPFNLDLNQIGHTPTSVLVMMPRSEYVKLNIGTMISHRYLVDIVCGETMLAIIMKR